MKTIAKANERESRAFITEHCNERVPWTQYSPTAQAQR
jgi:hypothetical protein